jgi:hypothetical protein
MKLTVKNSFYLSISILIIALSCKKKTPDNAQLIVDECIEAHGGNAYKKLNINFDFRDKHYSILKKGDQFTYERVMKDTSGIVTKDVMTNERFERFINNKSVSIPDSIAIKYKNSINSVVYFALLPQPLNDAAVNKTYIGEVVIGGQKYHKIKVTFEKENGGKDHEDLYIYWINQQSKFMDYFAYSYKVDGGGIRFRERIGSKNVKGIRFQNYINYEPSSNEYAVEDLDKAFVEGKLRELSRIENLNIK